MLKRRHLVYACTVGIILPTLTICVGSQTLSRFVPRGKSIVFVATGKDTTWMATHRKRLFFESLVYLPHATQASEPVASPIPSYLFGNAVSKLDVSTQDVSDTEVVWRLRSGILFASFDSVAIFDTITQTVRARQGAVAYGEWIIPYIPTPWLAADFAVITCVALLLQHVCLTARARWRRRKARCEHCGYPLNETVQCPECGNTQPA